VEVVASLSQGRTAAAQCSLFTYKSLAVIFEPPCTFAGFDFAFLPVDFQSLSDADRNAYEVKVLQGSMDEIRARLSPQNQQMFQNCVEIHMQHIQLGLGQCGSLHPFMIQHV